MAMRLSVIFDGKNNKLKQSATGVSQSLDSVRTKAISAGQAIGFAFSTAAAINFTDQATNIRNRIRDITETSKEFSRVQQIISQTANQTRTDITATANLYARLDRALGDQVKTHEELAEIVGTINKSYALSGATAAEAEGSITQLSQALQSGTLRGEEFNSVAEQAPGIMEAIMKQTGRTRGELREMAAQGKLTTELVITSLRNYADEVDLRFGKTEQTIAQSFVVSKNAAIEFLGELDQVIGVTDGFATASDVIASTLGNITDSLRSGETQAAVSAWVDQFDTAFADIKNGFNGLYIDLEKSSLLLEAFGDELGSTLIRAAKEFPINMTTLVKLVTIELASLIDIGKAYGSAFAQVLGTELAKLVDKAGAYAKEMKDLLQFWDGDTFDLESALANSDRVAESLTQKILRERDKQVASSRAAANSAVQDAFRVRDESLSALKQQLEGAELLRQEYGQGGDDQGSTRRDRALNAVQNFAGQAANDDTYNKLNERYLSEEEALRAHYQRESEIIIAAVEARKITEEQGLELLTKAHQKHLTDTQLLANKKANAILSSSAQIFGGLAGIIGSFAGEQSSAYKALFAVSKGFAVAQGILNLTTAISNASALPWPTNIPAMAQAAATGAQLVSTIKGASYQGQAHDGLSRVPAANEGTFLLRRDEMVMNPRQRENFDRMAQSFEKNGSVGGGNVFNINNHISIDASGAEAGMEEKIQSYVDQSIERNNEQLREDFSSNGPLSQAFRGVA